ncbi:hypothetical protein EPUS_08229 [Endocarpon pusillum Z07020]|uniref:EGF-like domain-containing protein n=1 Tax=Endocarpon pusillum (strain Z07020 / HMAS-L-300199) TaxID=1263415 RepID=U1GIF5_ENDPU|nr:uncharacterized protein EPUS_08229 [Endocarpon pusillum Z07020]ERF71913.1 hypothetical protein EPUS_08229 [Endocarpon pusillum Z07020]
MDRKHFPAPSSGSANPSHYGPGPSPAQKLRERPNESPASEYSTPIGSPTGRGSPNRPANSTQPFSPRGPHPSRPPRPNEVMPIQAAKARSYLPSRTPPKSNDDLAQYWERSRKVSPKTTHGQSSDEGTSSEDVSTPSTFELPRSKNTTPPSGAPRKTQLVPPSSSRRGGGAQYPHGTLFSPILEESTDSNSKARASYASSKVVPSSWGSHPDDYNSDRIPKRTEEEEGIRNSPASPYSTVSMHDDTTGLVRHASAGKKMKPSLTKIRNPAENISSRKKEAIGLGTISAGVAAGALGSSRDNTPTPPGRDSPSQVTSGNRTIIIESSPSNSRSSSRDSGKGSSTLVEPIGRSRSPLASAASRSARQPASPLGVDNRPVSKGPSMSEKVPSNHRPPQLDMEAVRDSKARASITSLPDLIRRATRLAANLDRGKTASRTGLFDMFNAEKKQQRRRSGSISDILASFPPPSRGTPDGARIESRWPSPFPSKLNQRMSYLGSHESGSAQTPRSGRRCCGMSLCAFIIIMLLLAILISAAIVVPIVLIVLPRQRRAAANATGPSSLENCPASVPCQNGGISVISGDACRCVCVNGFTGDRCSTVAGPGCTTPDIMTGTEQYTNATLGNAIHRLLIGASTNYGISLNSTVILSLFSSNNLSCTGENALVTFGSQSMKVRDIAQKVAVETLLPTSVSVSSLRPTPAPQADLPSRLEQRQIATVNGIVFVMTSTASAIPISSSTSSSSSSLSSPSSSVTSASTTTTSSSSSLSSSSSSSSSPSSSQSPSPETIDFAGIAVLFVLEQSGQLNTAVQVQDNIQDFLLNRASRNDTMPLNSEGVDLSLNFATFSIALGNGTEIGGNGNGDGGLKDSELGVVS